MRRYIRTFISTTLILLILLLSGCTFPWESGLEDKQAATSSEEDSLDSSAADITGSTDKSTSTTSKAANTGTVGNIDTTANTGTAASSPAAKLAVTVYYQDKDGYLVPMTRWIEKQQGIARAAVSGLIDSALTREEIQYYGVYPVLPENTELQGINIKEGLAVVDLSPKVLNYADETAERNIVASLVYTLTEFKSVQNVKILVNGFTQKALKYGTDISGNLNRENIKINTKGAVNSKSAKADIFALKKANTGFTYLVPVSFDIDGWETSTYNGSDVKAEFASEMLVKLLLSKRVDAPLESMIPSGASLKSCKLANGILTIDIDPKNARFDRNATQDGILKQLVYTVRQVSGINSIKFLMNGVRVELPGSTDILKGISLQRTINDYIDQ